MRLSTNALLRPLAAIAGFAALSLSAGPILAAEPIVAGRNRGAPRRTGLIVKVAGGSLTPRPFAWIR